MRISARNQIKGSVVEVMKGATTSHVRVDIGGGQIVTSSITNEAVADLALAKGDEMKHFFWQHIADAGDRAARTTIDETVKDLRVDADHQRDVGRLADNMLGRVAQRFGAAELFEAEEMGVTAPQFEE